MPTEVKTEDFERAVLQARRPTLVDFWGSWCIPCKQMEPVLEALAASRPDLAVVKVNVNRNRPLVSQYRIMGVPTFVLFQLFNVLNCRSDRRSVFRLSFSGSRFLVANLVTVVVLLLVIIYIPFLQGWFYAVPLTLAELGICLVAALPILLVDEVRKALGVSIE